MMMIYHTYLEEGCGSAWSSSCRGSSRNINQIRWGRVWNNSTFLSNVLVCHHKQIWQWENQDTINIWKA
jgi:hypothetical protein